MFKRKEIANNKSQGSNTSNPKENRNRKMNFSTTTQTKYGEEKGQSSWFSDGLWKKKLNEGSQEQQAKHFRLNKLTRYQFMN